MGATKLKLTEPFGALCTLLLREEWRGWPGGSGGRSGVGFAERHQAAGRSAIATTLLTACAALGAGEPKRARQILDTGRPLPPGDAEVLGQALRLVAEFLERNWFPGSSAAVLAPGDIAELTMGAAPQTVSPSAGLVVTMATRFLAALPTWRRLVAAGDAGVVNVALREADEVLRELSDSGVPMVVAPAALAVADLFVRAGRRAEADRLLGLARQDYQVARDPVGLAACELVQGDWLAAVGPEAHPELLGEQLEVGLERHARPDRADPERAERHWAVAETGFAAAGAIRGIAAVALRRAAHAVTTGRPGEAVPLLERAGALADEAGDGALAALAAVHRALVRIEVGDPVDPQAVGEDIGAWATTVGSTSFARGLARLCVAKSRRWRDGVDVRRSRQAHLLAEAINTRVGAVTEAAMLRSEQAARYGAANYRRAALVLLLAELDQARRRSTPPLGVLAWLVLVQRVATAVRDAHMLRDGDALQRVGELARWLRGVTPSPETDTEVFGVARSSLDEVVAETAIYVPLYHGIAARAAGDLETAQQHLGAALGTAIRSDLLTLAVILGHRHQFDEAFLCVEQLVDSGLPPDLAARLAVRLKRYDAALTWLDQTGQQGGQQDGQQGGRSSGEQPPWDAAALEAEIRLGTGDPVTAAARAAEAIRLFERHLTGLALDVFRTMAHDDLTVAGLYTTAVRAHVQLAEMDPDAAEDHLARAFELSDRSRSSSLKDLLAELAKPDGDEAGGSTGAVVSAALRAWHGAGAVLARTVEQVGNAAPGAYTPDDIQRRVRAAERELDDAEAALAVAAPRLLANRPRLPATPALREIQQRLDVRTLLLQYHAFDDELIGWAVTRDSVRCRRRARETTLLTADVRRFHQMLVKPQSWADERDALARPLAALLLEPFTDELRAYQRVVVVSHGPLAVLPFHVLPFADDVLAATHTLSYLPSASMVPAEQALPRLGPDAQALVVGDLAYGAERGLSHLRCSSVEAFAVAQLHGTSALIPAAATRDAVLERLRTARLAHLATHGIFHERAPYSAEIALTGKASLTVPDLIRLGTSIDLAVLSACDTARGRATAVGDLIGPSRAFIAAGARELVVSLWPVDDRFVCLTMVAFHEQLTRGVPASLALARAQAQIRALSSVEAAHRWYRSLPYKARRRRSGEYRGSGTRSPSVEEQEPRVPEVPSHPFYWAPFIHIGTS